MSNSENTVRYVIEAHWATEELLNQMAEEVMSDEGYAVYLRFVETRKRVQRDTYNNDDDDVTETDTSPEAGWGDV
jgi:hypothetical protein